MKTRVIQDVPDAVRPELPVEPGSGPEGPDRPSRGRQGPPPLGPRRVVLLVLGGLSTLLALALLAGGVALTVALGERDRDGWFTSGTRELSTGAHAFVAEDLDVEADAPGFVLGERFGTARFEATSAKPVFLGVGPSDAVARYLDGVQRARVMDVDADPFAVSTRLEGGGAQPAAPASQGFWRVQDSGPGTRSVSWSLEEGDWTAVAMNADGSRVVDLEARTAARIPWLPGLAIGLLVGGALVLVLGGGLLRLGARSRTRA